MKNSKLKTRNLTFCIIVLIFTFFIFHFNCFAADTLTITTYYPSPYGVYKTLRVYPNTDCAVGGACNKGEICYNSTGDQFLMCGSTSLWAVMGGGGYWAVTPSDPNSIYNTNTGTGNVGIGTNNPDTNAIVTIEGKVDPMAGVAALRWRPSDMGVNPPVGFLGFDTPAGAGTVDNNVLVGATGASNANLLFRTGGVYRMIVSNNGNVGIGTTTPSDMLSIYKGSNADILRLASTSGAANYSGIRFEGTVGGWALAAIRGMDAGSYNGDLVFYTDGDSTSNVNLQERMRISNTGYVGIGTASPSVPLDVNGDVQVGLSTTSSAGLVAYTAVGSRYLLARWGSSIRYKKNIKDFTLGLDIVKKLRPVSFDWKESGESDFGFIAEDAEKVYQPLVTYLNGKPESFKYLQYVAILTNAIKEQQKEIEDLKSAVAELSKKLEAKK